jgi:hypothetical protein
VLAVRLINAETLDLQEFDDTQIPEYAIVSHRWRDDEVSLRHYERVMLDSGERRRLRTIIALKGTRDIGDPAYDSYIESRGLWKIISTCIQAKRDGLNHVRLHTCAIDKTSSTEEQEAINSMYRWYEQSKICYVFLDDVPADIRWDTSDDELERLTATTEWLKRGWTLQEFIAPARVDFFGRAWNYVGSKTSAKCENETEPLGACEVVSKNEMLSRLTGVPLAAIVQTRLRNDYSVAQRMAWAAERLTNRSEDRAYSLLGLSDINMPLLYGEGGARAFRRLQEEIARQILDHSILAWDGSKMGDKWENSILAPSPDCFADSAHIINIRAHKEPMSFFSTGLRTSLPVIALGGDDRWCERYYALLDC